MIEGEEAQKQVVRITSCLAVSRAGRRGFVWRVEPVPRVKEERAVWGAGVVEGVRSGAG